MIQSIIHYGIHFGLPLVVSLLFFKSMWRKAYLLMLLGILIDLDHLLATPMFDPNRCSINFHPLHSYYAIAVYFIMLIPNKSRILAIGLLIHVLADSIDCWLMQ